MVPGWNSAEAKAARPQQPPAPAVGAGGGVATLPAVRPGTADPGLVCNTTAGTPAAQQPAMPGSAGKSDGSNLFDALLLAASGGVARLGSSLLSRHTAVSCLCPLLLPFSAQQDLCGSAVMGVEEGSRKTVQRLF